MTKPLKFNWNFFIGLHFTSEFLIFLLYLSASESDYAIVGWKAKAKAKAKANDNDRANTHSAHFSDMNENDGILIFSSSHVLHQMDKKIKTSLICISTQQP